MVLQIKLLDLFSSGQNWHFLLLQIRLCVGLWGVLKEVKELFLLGVSLFVSVRSEVELLAQMWRVGLGLKNCVITLCVESLT